MWYGSLFLLFILAASKAEDYECPNQIGSGLPDYQQVTTVPYCIVDECTIVTYESRQQLQLDIIYTTDSLLVVTPAGNQTAMVIARTNEGVHCISEAQKAFQFLVPVTIRLVLGLVSGYIIIIYLVFKDMHTSFGLLMVLYNGAIIFQCLTAVPILFMQLYGSPYSPTTCYVVQFIFMQGIMVSEVFATCLIAHIAYIMYYSNKLRTELPTMKMFKHYTIYVASVLGLFNFFIVGYDVATGNSRNAILLNGICSPLNTKYNTTDIAWACVAFNKTVQVTLFAIFLKYLYKHKKGGKTENATANKLLNKLFIKISVIMGAIIGINQVLWLMVIVLDFHYLSAIAGNFLLVIQQHIIMGVVSYKKMAQACSKDCGQ